MTPQLFYNTGIDHLLDEQLNHLRNMKEDIDLNLPDDLSAKQGKQAWPLNQTDTDKEERGKQMCACLCTQRANERKEIPHNWTRTSPPTASRKVIWRFSVTTIPST